MNNLGAAFLSFAAVIVLYAAAKQWWLWRFRRAPRVHLNVACTMAFRKGTVITVDGELWSIYHSTLTEIKARKLLPEELWWHRHVKRRRLTR